MGRKAKNGKARSPAPERLQLEVRGNKTAPQGTGRCGIPESQTMPSHGLGVGWGGEGRGLQSLLETAGGGPHLDSPVAGGGASVRKRWHWCRYSRHFCTVSERDTVAPCGGRGDTEAPWVQPTSLLPPAPTHLVSFFISRGR